MVSRLWLLLLVSAALHLVGRGVAAAPTSDPDPTILASAIHSKTICCLKSEGAYDLLNVTTLDACAEICGARELKPVQLSGSRFACSRPDYACDSVGTGGSGCSECYQQGSCYLIPFLGGITSQQHTKVSKLQRATEDNTERQYEEQGQGVRDTGIGGREAVRTRTQGQELTTQTGEENLLTKTKTQRISSDNFDFRGFGGDLPPGVTPDTLAQLGTSGTISNTEVRQLGNNRNVLLNRSGSGTTTSRDFQQDLSLLSPGQQGAYFDRGVSRREERQLTKQATQGTFENHNRRTHLTGTAARGAGNVELSEERQRRRDQTASITRREAREQGIINQELHLNNGRSGVHSRLQGKERERSNTVSANRGTSTGETVVRQAATNQGLKRSTAQSEHARNQFTTQTHKENERKTRLQESSKCANCYGKKTVDTSTRSSGGSTENLTEETKRKRKTDLQGSRGQGAIQRVSDEEQRRYLRQKRSDEQSSEQTGYTGTSGHLGLNGGLHSRVLGRSSTSTRRKVIENEQGVSTDQLHALSRHSFPGITR